MMINRTSLVVALAALAAGSVSTSFKAQQKYWPDRPPMSVSFQGAERPSWYSLTFFCGAVYEWDGDKYGMMGRVMENAYVRIGVRADRRDSDVDAPFTGESSPAVRAPARSSQRLPAAAAKPRPTTSSGS